MKIVPVLAGLALVVVVGVAAWMSRDSGAALPADARSGTTGAVDGDAADPGRAPRVIASAGGSAGDTYAVDAQEGLAVFGRGTDLVVADVSNPAEPVQLGTADLGAPIRDVVLQGDRAFVASDSTGFHIVDLSDPSLPKVSASMRFDDRVYGVDADERHVYIAARSAGLHVLDVADPEKPVRVGHIQTPDDAVDVVVRGDYAYVAAWYESMRVIDVSDPASPEEVSFASYDSYDNGTAWSVYVEGDLGFATVPDMGLRTVDISNPRDVKLHRVYRGLFAPVAVAARGLTAFVADQDAGFRVLRLDDPANPVEIGTLQIPGRAVGVVLSGDHAYVAAREGGLRILDVSLPYRPREVGRLDPSDEIVDVAGSGATVVAAGSENGVHVYRYAEGLDQTAFYPVPARRVRIRDNRIYAASGTGIHLLGNGAVASIVSDLPAPPEGFDVSGGLIAVAGGPSGLHIYHTEQGGSVAAGDHARAASEFHAERQLDPARADIQLLRGPVAAWDVILAGETAYAAFDDGIRSIDLSNPDAPQMLDHLSMNQRVYRLELIGSRLYAACDDGIRLIDVSDPDALQERAYLKTPSFATAILVDGQRIYAGDLSGVMSVVDADDPQRVLADWKLGDRMYGFARLSDGLAIAAGKGGLQVIATPAVP